MAAWLHFVDTCQRAIGEIQLARSVDPFLMPTLLNAAAKLHTHANRLLSRQLLLRIASKLDSGESEQSDRTGHRERQASIRLSDLQGDASSALDPRVQAVLDRVHTGRIRHRREFTHVARSLRVSPSYLSRLVVTQTGITFNRHLQAAKMGESARLLDESDLSVKEIASATGYEHVPSFDRQFRRYFRITPSEFRRHARRAG